MIVRPTVKQIFEQLNRMLAEKAAQGNIIEHNLEKGLGTERAIRELLKNFLPVRFGVAKGKIVNFTGGMSQQADVIIYDRLNCPTLFIDENENQIIPLEGVYAVLEVKTTLTKHTLTEAFDNLNSVYRLQPERPVRSSNPKVNYRPPQLDVVGFRGVQLSTLEKHFRTRNAAHKVQASSSAFSTESPGYAHFTGETFLVHSISCLGSGSVFHSLNGQVRVRPWGAYTLGMLLTTLLSHFEQISLSGVRIYDYFNYHMIEQPGFFNDALIQDSSGDGAGEPAQASAICPDCGTPRTIYGRKLAPGSPNKAASEAGRSADTA